MSKRESIVFQANQVLKQSAYEGYGRSRHADKKNAMNNKVEYDTYTKDKIYGQKTYRSTNKTCISFVKHCREEFGVKYISEIIPEMFKSFISKGNFKTDVAYDPKTAATYASQVTKLQNAFNVQNDATLVFVDNSYKEFLGVKKHKRDQMPRNIHDKIIQNCYETKYVNGLAFELARALGLRVREITDIRKKDFYFNNNQEFVQIHIHRSKGGRSRDIEASNLSITQIQVVCKVYQYFYDITGEHDRFFTNKSESYEKAFSRARDAISSEYTHCGIHSMRKEFAKDYYSRELSKGKSRLKIKKELTGLLGHNRLEVLGSYLKEEVEK